MQKHHNNVYPQQSITYKEMSKKASCPLRHRVYPLETTACHERVRLSSHHPPTIFLYDSALYRKELIACLTFIGDNLPTLGSYNCIDLHLERPAVQTLNRHRESGQGLVENQGTKDVDHVHNARSTGLDFLPHRGHVYNPDRCLQKLTRYN